MTSQPTPAVPAHPPEYPSPAGTPQRITLRRSVAMHAVTGVFALIAVAAVYTGLTPWLGAWRAMPPAMAAFAMLALGAIRLDRMQPASLKVGPDGLSVWNRAGELLMQGPVAGHSQWSGRLLVLQLASGNGCLRALLIAADMLPAGAFRALAVLGRRGAQS